MNCRTLTTILDGAMADDEVAAIDCMLDALETASQNLAELEDDESAYKTRGRLLAELAASLGVTANAAPTTTRESKETSQ